MTDDQRAAPENGIWLCAACHTYIDKNEGVHVLATTLVDWKRRHEAVISSLLYTHRSPWPIIRKFTEEGRVAQKVVDELENHGALFLDHSLEDARSVVTSIERLRSELMSLSKRVSFDTDLKNLIRDLVAELRTFMNNTSALKANLWPELNALRSRVGLFGLRLRRDYGCNVRGPLNNIIPPV